MMQKNIFALYFVSCYLFWKQTFNILLFSSVAFVAVKDSFCAFCKFMLKLFLSGNWVKQYQIENLRQLFNFKQFSNAFLQKHSIKCFGSVFTIVVVLNWVVLWSWRVEKSGLLLYILRYESSSLILYKKLSSSIFQSLSVSESVISNASVTSVQISTLSNI